MAKAEEPIRFHGAYIDQPASDYIDCSTGNTLGGWINPGTGEKPDNPKLLKKLGLQQRPLGAEVGRLICAGGEHNIFRANRSMDKDLLNFFDLTWALTISGDVLRFKDGKVSEIVINMDTETFANVAADMTAKLKRGPDNTTPEVYRNAFGTEWSFGKKLMVGQPHHTRRRTCVYPVSAQRKGS